METTRLREMAESILAGIGDGVIATNLEGKIIYMNQEAAEIADCQQEDAVGREFDSVIMICDATDGSRVISPVACVLELDEKTGLKKNSIIYTGENTKKYISATCSPMKTEEGRTIGVVMILRDISQIVETFGKNGNEKGESSLDRNNTQENRDDSPGIAVIAKEIAERIGQLELFLKEKNMYGAKMVAQQIKYMSEDSDNLKIRDLAMRIVLLTQKGDLKSMAEYLDKMRNECIRMQ